MHFQVSGNLGCELGGVCVLICLFTQLWFPTSKMGILMNYFVKNLEKTWSIMLLYEQDDRADAEGLVCLFAWLLKDHM